MELDSIQIRIETAGAARVIHAAGALTIATAGELKRALLAAPAVAGDILDLSGLTEADLAGLQLLCSYRCGSPNAHTRNLRAMPEWLVHMATEAGFESLRESPAVEV